MKKWSDLVARTILARNGELKEVAELLRGLAGRETAIAKKTASATAGAATLAALAGKVTSEALTTAAAGVYTLTITNTEIAADDIVLASVAYGTATAGEPMIERVTPAAGSVVIRVKNTAAAAALDGTIVVSFAVQRVAD